MYYTPRTIAQLVELLHPPQPLEAAAIQRVHNRLFQEARPEYQSFTVAGDRAVLSNPVAIPGAASSAAFLADRIQVREELTGLSLDEYVERVDRLLTHTLAERPLQVLTAVVVTLRALVNPREFHDSRQFLREGMFGFGEELEALGREPQLLGLRLAFAPDAEHPEAYALRVESYTGDPRSLFLENQGTFGPVVVARGLAEVGERVRGTYDFLAERVPAFLRPFDRRAED